MNKTLKIYLITVGGLLIAGILGIFISRSISHWRHIRSMDEEITYTLEAPRGKIYDVDGHIIATSTTAYDVYLDCALIQSEAEWKEKTADLAPRLALLLPERNASQWWDYLQAGRKENQGYLNIAKGITADIKDSLARRTIGYVHAYEKPRVGLKGKYDSILKGVDGYRVILHNEADERRHKKEIRHQEAVPGTDLHTTLSLPLQEAADSSAFFLKSSKKHR